MSSRMLAVSAAALLAVVPAVRAGSTIINNNCGQNLYVWANQGFNETSQMMTLAPGGTNKVPYQGEAICIKIHSEPNAGGDNTELEYSSLGDGTLFYDLSNIVGFPEPMKSKGVSLKPSKGTCPSVVCPPGIPCADAYNYADQVATKACTTDSDLTLDLCGEKGSAPPAPAVPAPAPPAPKPAPPAYSAPPAAAPPAASHPAAPPVNQQQAAPSSQAPPPPAPPAPTSAPPAPAAPAPPAHNTAAVEVGPNGHVYVGGSSGAAQHNNAAANNNNNANVVWVTEYTTVGVPRGEPTAGARQRRHVHHHAAHGHH